MNKTLLALATVPLMTSTALAGVVTSENEYLEMGFEELLSVELTSGSRRAQTIEDSAASVFVINQDDIARSPARNIPELLRMVPGLQVARVDHNNYRVSIRGGSQLYANKLLVMIDGRSVYTPTFGGVFWDQHDLMLDDIDRIEVVRGPGGTVWGANATNGVINIITKSAEDTTGLYANVEVGTEDEPTVGLRLGTRLSTGGAVRLGAQYTAKPDISPNAPAFRPDAFGLIQVDGENSYESGRLSFRLDQPLGEKTDLVLTSAVQRGEFGEAFGRGGGFLQAHVMGRLERETETGGIIAQVFADHSDRQGYGVGVTVNTWDIDVSHHFRAGERHNVVWGGGFRYLSDQFTKVAQDTEETDWRASLFAQDEISLTDALQITLGSKFEYNSVTGFEVQPSVRALYHFSEQRTIWGAVSRSVRTPSRADRSVQFDVAIVDPGVPLTTFGSEDVDSEISYTAEIGYRSRVTDRLSLEASLFGTLYEDLIFERDNPATQPPAFPVFANILDNVAEGTSYGVEIAANANPIDRLTMQLAYSFVDLDIEVDDPATFALPSKLDLLFNEAGTARHLASLRSSLEVTDALTASSWVRYTSEPAKTELGDAFDVDLRLTYAPEGPFRASLIGENLLNGDDEFEAVDYITTLTELSPVERRVTAKIELGF